MYSNITMILKNILVNPASIQSIKTHGNLSKVPKKYNLNMSNYESHIFKNWETLKLKHQIVKKNRTIYIKI